MEGLLNSTFSKKIGKFSQFLSRHPLQERLIDSFIPNDTKISEVDMEGNVVGAKHRTILLTGPNFSGKSIYLTQVALITFMAHIGSFIPADSAEIGLTDQILTRVHSRETVSKAQSTFMIDLSQIGVCLKSSTARSLLLFDEFGKGTVTSNGIGLFVGALEELLERGKDCPKVIAATHFHEIYTYNLIKESQLLGHFKMDIVCEDRDATGVLTFLYKVVAGTSETSWGFYCAKLAGIPDEEVKRAQTISRRLMEGEIIDSSDVNPERDQACAAIARLFSGMRGSQEDVDQEINRLWEALEEVKEFFLLNKKGVVALESTIISHGLPYPQNYNTALELEKIVTSHGCTPAHIAIINGKIKVGLLDEELHQLAKEKNVVKASRRDIAHIVALGKNGATTVSATMLIAHLCGIKVFVTGGIGGVHRGAENSMDISADLTELGRTPVTVVCSGVKSILDIEKTLEYLETQGVTVLTYGSSEEFPAFYSPSSGFKSMAAMDNPHEIATVIDANMKLDLKSGIVVGVPIPGGGVEGVDTAIKKAIKEAEKNGIKGKDITPYLLSKVSKITKGKSLDANISLIKNNAKVGSLIAKSLENRQVSSNPKVFSKGKRPVIVGGIVMDICSKPTPKLESDLTLATSHPGKVTKLVGGVAKNIAEACFRTRGNPFLVSAVGNDSWGDWIKSDVKNIGMEVLGIERKDGQTAIYSSLLNGKGELISAVADMDILEHVSMPHEVENILGEKPSVICFDGNLSVSEITRILQYANQFGIPTIFEPTSVMKSVKIFQNAPKVDLVPTFITPNILELGEMLRFVYKNYNSDRLLMVKIPESDFIPKGKNVALVQLLNLNPRLDVLDEVSKLITYFPNIILKMGKLGVVVACRDGESMKFKRLEPERILDDVESVNGAGDSLVGTFTTLLSQFDGTPSFEEVCNMVRVSMKAAELSLMSKDNVSKELNTMKLE
ncbi:hypothetical protein HK098_008234 [Nowakowskiella sp. JEL0407]|nr:hypothetical protein HK098_008234 [Nowakowskiella sp. JEL0407]